MITIIPFEDRYAADVKQLNTAWLEKYFYVEENDKLQLDHLRETIIDKGGYIFLARDNDVIAGTVSLIKESGDSYELSKMAVTPASQGKGISRLLMDACIALAREKKWRRLFLYSNTILETAIALYRKYGFREIPLEENSHYRRSNIKMELNFF
jgi:GNAT superfamily N-acetyltransferase